MFNIGDRVRVVGYDEKFRFSDGFNGQEFTVKGQVSKETRKDGSVHAVFNCDGYFFADDELELVV